MKRKKKWLIIAAITVVVVLVIYGWHRSTTQWTRDLNVVYVDRVSRTDVGNHSESSYDLYEITNTTDVTLKEVVVIISVDTIYGEFKYEDSVSYTIKPGETVEYRLYDKDYQSAAQEQSIELGFLSVSSVEIVKIKYTK